MIQKLKRNRFYPQLFTYSFLSFMKGATLLSVGPMIPYMAELSGKSQTDYSYLFTSRSLGAILGALFLRWVQNRITIPYHKIMSICILLICLSCQIFTYIRNPVVQGFCLFIISFSTMIISICDNVCILQVFAHCDVQCWITVVHAHFGIGAAFAPLLVYIFEVNALSVAGFMFLLIIPFMLKIKQSQVIEKQEKSIYEKPQNYQNPIAQHFFISENIKYAMAFMMFIQVALEWSYGNWISSYAVLSGESSPAKSTVFNSIFWSLITIFRFVFAFINVTSIRKLWIVQFMALISFSIVVVLIWIGQIIAVCYISAILLGISWACIYPVTLSTPVEAGLRIAPHQTNVIITLSSFAEGTLVAFVGELMGWFGINALFYSFLLMMLSSIVALSYLTKWLKKQRNSKENESITDFCLEKTTVDEQKCENNVGKSVQIM